MCVCVCYCIHIIGYYTGKSPSFQAIVVLSVASYKVPVICSTPRHISDQILHHFTQLLLSPPVSTHLQFNIK